MNNQNNKGQINIANDNANINATQNKSPLHNNSGQGQVNKIKGNATINAFQNTGINMTELKENLCVLKKILATSEMYVEAGKIKDVVEIIDSIYQY